MKRFFRYLLLVIILIPFTINAEITTYERNANNNYGVNKDIKITDKNKNDILNTKYVDASARIYDFSNILTDEEEATLKEEIDEFENKTGFTLVILIDDLFYTDDDDVKNRIHADNFYMYNDFGMNTSTYDGIILYRNTYMYDKYYGNYFYGNAQLYYADRSDYILDCVYNDIHSGDYLEGFTKWIGYLTDYYNEGESKQMDSSFVNKKGYVKSYKTIIEIIIISLFISFGISAIVVLIYVYRNKMVRVEDKASNYIDSATSKISTIKTSFLRSNSVYLGERSSSSSSSSNSFSGGSSGGFTGSSGYHSSGGGRHG